jgi:hypothetical protein
VIHYLEGQTQVTSQQIKGQLEIISFEISERLYIERVHKEKSSYLSRKSYKQPYNHPQTLLGIDARYKKKAQKQITTTPGREPRGYSFFQP